MHLHCAARRATGDASVHARLTAGQAGRVLGQASGEALLAVAAPWPDQAYESLEQSSASVRSAVRCREDLGGDPMSHSPPSLARSLALAGGRWPPASERLRVLYVCTVCVCTLQTYRAFLPSSAMHARGLAGWLAVRLSALLFRRRRA